MTFIDTSEETKRMLEEISNILKKYGYKDFDLWKNDLKENEFNIEVFPK